MQSAQVSLLVSLALCSSIVASLHHHDHDRIFLVNEHIHASSAPSFHQESHPSAHLQHLTLQQRLDDVSKHTFVVHFASREHLHTYKEHLLNDADVLVESYLPQNSYLVHMSHQTAHKFSKHSFVDFVGYFKPSHKLAKNIHQPKSFLSKTVQVDLIHEFAVDDLAKVWLNSNPEFAKTIVVQDSSASKRILFLIKNRSEDLLKTFASFLSHQREVLEVSRKHIVVSKNRWAKAIVQTGADTETDYSTLTTDLLYWNKGLTGAGQIVGVGDTGLDYRSCYHADVESATPPEPPFKTWKASANQADMISETDLKRRKIVQYVKYGNGIDNDGHGTHVSGSVAGYPVNDSLIDYRNYSGSARDAKIAFFDIEASVTSGLELPTDMVADYFPWAYAAGARIHSNSWGSETPEYTSDSRDFDKYSYNNKDFIALVAAGNEGSCGTEDATVGSPATAKNVIAVGATVNSALQWDVYSSSQYNTYMNDATFSEVSMASFSSQGPTSDGRLKPDVSAPGYFITSSVFNQTQGSVCSQDNFATAVDTMAGTSMATPTLAGNLAIVRQYFSEGFYPCGEKTKANSFSPSGSLLKALAINGAVNMIGDKVSSSSTNNAGTEACAGAGMVYILEERPSVVQGFGRFQADQILYLPSKSPESYLFIPSFSPSNTAEFYDAKITNGDSKSFNFCAFPSSSDREIRITLVWTDPPASTVSQFSLINDLDLVVNYQGSSINGNTQSGYLAYAADYVLQQHGITVETSKDALNNVEAVYLTPPTSTEGKQDITITISGANVVQGPQAYSLVVSGYLSEGKCAQVQAAKAPDCKIFPDPVKTMSAGAKVALAIGIIVIVFAIIAGCMFFYAKRHPESKLGRVLRAQKIASPSQKNTTGKSGVEIPNSHQGAKTSGQTATAAPL